MKHFLLALTIGLLTQATHAQTLCNATFSKGMAPTGNALLRAQINNTSALPTAPNKIAKFTVDWGDGSAHATWTGNLAHNYASPGTYPLELVMVVYDSIGTTLTMVCSDTARDTISVSYSACATSISVTNNSPSVNVSANTPAGTSGMTYTWNWGDGTPNSTGATATHTYTTNGYKTITLTAANGTGCTYTNPWVEPVTNTCNGMQNAIFSLSLQGADVGCVSNSSFIPGKTMKHSWNFGDGNSQNNLTSPFAYHTYTTGGTYDITLVTTWYDTTTNQPTCHDSFVRQVVIPIAINGFIVQDTFATIPHVDSCQYKVWLILFDSASNTLTAVDSVVTVHGFSMYTPFQFGAHPAGAYRVKAKLLNGPSSGAGWVPTYHYNSLMWNSANTISNLVSNVMINMRAGTVTSGPGFIGGNVSAGANKGTGAGIAGMTVILLDANGKMVKADATDANGNYSFDNLPPASYSVYPEDMGYTTTPAAVTVVNNKPTINGINFERTNSTKSITPVATSISNVSNGSIDFAVYPNPASGKVNIRWNSNLSKTAEVSLSDVTGKIVYTTAVNGNGNAVIHLDELQKGLYFITISANNVQETRKLLLQ